MQLWLQGLPNQTNEYEIVWVKDRKWADCLSYEQPRITLLNDFDTYTMGTFYVKNNKLNEIDFIILLHKELNDTRCYQINPSSLECTINLIWNSSTHTLVWNLSVTQFFPTDCLKRENICLNHATSCKTHSSMIRNALQPDVGNLISISWLWLLLGIETLSM